MPQDRSNSARVPPRTWQVVLACEEQLAASGAYEQCGFIQLAAVKSRLELLLIWFGSRAKLQQNSTNKLLNRHQ